MAVLSWEPMLPVHLAGVKVLSDRVHPGLEERLDMFADRLAVHPRGSRVVVGNGVVMGYTVSHPARLFEPLPLNHLLGSADPEADSYYIHDLVVAPELRGQGLARGVVAELLGETAFPITALVAVYGTSAFWSGFGFADESSTLPAGKLAAYGADASYLVRRAPLAGDILDRHIDVLQKD